MFAKLFPGVPVLFAICLVGAQSWGREVVLGLTGCNESSIATGVRFSVEDIRSKAELVLDSLYVDSVKAEQCGYKLFRNEDSVVIIGATTGVDLWLRIKDFFGFDERVNYDSVFSGQTRYSYKADNIPLEFKEHILLKTRYDL